MMLNLVEASLTMADAAALASDTYDKHGLPIVAVITVTLTILQAFEVPAGLFKFITALLFGSVVAVFTLHPAAVATRWAAEVKYGEVEVAAAFTRAARSEMYQKGRAQSADLVSDLRECEAKRSALLAEGKCVETKHTEMLTSYRLVCADGWKGSSCGCGGGRGCCSWHGGIGYCQVNTRENAYTQFDGMRVTTPEGVTRALECDCTHERVLRLTRYNSALKQASNPASSEFDYLVGWNDEAARHNDFNELIFPTVPNQPTTEQE